ncbi:restriction endonuclease subunit S [Polyangium aurulentum]|uniref:restriction endonuclease subunit S n=1 Tax=Polyangium aurulentum TaxID=2567896 RepID=UPI0010AE6B43|nr:restriction endonuclease subunit S [Polyangium aurulentum]UQA63260.1 restriction endonuclease subunit S [Polyangium aurulentum]
MNPSAQWRMSTVGAVLIRTETGKSVKTQERPTRDDEFGILRVSAVTWGEFNPRENKAVLPGYDPGACPRVSKNDLLISRANTLELVGAAVLVDRDYPNLLLSDKIIRLVPDKNLVEPRYLLRALRTSATRQHFAARAGGTSGSMQNISQEDIRSTPLPLPPLQEQRRIADILNKADAIRRKRNEAIALTEELLRSTFLEMFGDPVVNPRGWPTRTLDTLIDVGRGISYGIVQRGEDVDNGVPVVRISNLAGNRFDGTSVVRTSAHISSAYRRTVLRGNELLISIRGTVGRVAEAPLSAAGWNVSREIAVIPLLDGVSRPFVHRALLTDGIQRFILGNVKGVAQSGINLSDLRKAPIPTPPRDLIARFERCAESVLHVESSLLHAQAQADRLFDSLIDRAFRGELTKPTAPAKTTDRQLALFE